MTISPKTAAALAVIMISLLASAPVAADAVLVGASPADQGIVGGTVQEIQIVFNELVTDGDISLGGPEGAVPIIDQTRDGQVISARFVPLTIEGRYSVTYSVISADTDPVGGSLGFSYALDGPPQLPVSVPALQTGAGPLVVAAVVIGLAVVVLLAGQTYLRTRRLRELSRWDGVPSDT